MTPCIEVDHIGVSGLRGFNASKLRGMTKIVMVHGPAGPVAMLIPYDRYMEMQQMLIEAVKRAQSLELDTT